MKIAQITSLYESVPPENKNGLEFLVHFLTEGLVSNGHQVSLFATADSETSGELIDLWPRAVSRDKPAQLVPDYMFSRWSHEEAYLSADKFDLLHSHDISGMFWSQLPRPLLVTVHSPVDQVLLEYKDNFPQEYWAYLDGMREKITRANLVFVSKDQCSSFPPGDNHYVVHNGLPVERFDFRSVPEDYFAFLGYITSNKGADLAVKVALEAGVKLKLAGQADKKGFFYREKIKPYLGRNIEYLGPLDFEEKVSFLGRARGTLVPIQWREPFGLVMIESLACGTPVIALDRAAVGEIVKDGEVGYLCKDVADMVEATGFIEKLSRKKCREHIELNFSVQQMIKNYEQVYNEVISNFRKFSKDKIN